MVCLQDALVCSWVKHNIKIIKKSPKQHKALHYIITFEFVFEILVSALKVNYQY